MVNYRNSLDGDYVTYDIENENSVDKDLVVVDNSNDQYEQRLLVYQDEDNRTYLSPNTLTMLLGKLPDSSYSYNEHLGLCEIAYNKMLELVGSYQDDHPDVKLIVEYNKINTNDNTKPFSRLIEEDRKTFSNEEVSNKNDEMEQMIDDDSVFKDKGINGPRRFTY